ncbi:hypothetical protein P2318_29725 [Myxococcaceae bacterium GXIMD 01537]
MTRLGRWGLGAALLGLAVQAVRLALHKSFSIDEFQYAHAAWLVAHGQVPYRDFFEVHFPLLYQGLSMVFRVLGDDPLGVVALRGAMLGPLALTGAALAFLNRRHGTAAALLAPALLLATPAFVTLATEVRPDALAIALFLGALACLLASPSGAARWAFAAGVLGVAAAWGSQKVLFHGGLVGAVLAVDLVVRRGRAPALVSAPRALLAGGAAALLSIAAYLTLTRSWGAWWHWCFVWAAEHQRHYPGFSWRAYFDPVWRESPWLFTLAALGLAATMRRWWRAGARWGDPEWLLLLCAPATFGAYALQRAPFPYSLLPFLAVSALFAARGAAEVLGALTAPTGRFVGGAALAVLLASQAWRLEQVLSRSGNAGQREVLARVARLTGPGDTAYDNSGGYVARPHAHFYFYTDAYLRQSIPDALAREVPRALVASGCVLYLADLRSEALPAPLKRFLAEHYQPFDGDISLWGQRYEVPGDGKLEGRFLAVRADRYFVEPARALEEGALLIDGVPVREPVFSLSQGEHVVRYAGPARSFQLLWLPRDGQRWTPRPGVPAGFSRLF